MKINTPPIPLEDLSSVSPMGEIAGFPVRPGFFDINGAMDLGIGVNFTIHTCYGTRCELLLFQS